MNLNKAIYDLIENNSSIQFNELLFDYETYEEPPLIHRYIEIEPFKKYLKKEDLNTFLFNLAVTHLNNVKLYAKKCLSKNAYSNFFICITYTDDDCWVDNEGFFIPNFLVTQKENVLNFKSLIKKNEKVDMNKYPIIKRTLLELGLYKEIDVYHKKWFDSSCQDYIQRFYFINK